MIPIAPQLSSGGYSDLADIPRRPGSQDENKELTPRIQKHTFLITYRVDAVQGNFPERMKFVTTLSTWKMHWGDFLLCSCDSKVSEFRGECADKSCPRKGYRLTWSRTTTRPPLMYTLKWCQDFPINPGDCKGPVVCPRVFHKEISVIFCSQSLIKCLINTS